MENRKSIKEQCIELDMEGYLFQEISEKLHIPIADVYNYVVGVNYSTRCDDDIIRTLTDQGLTCREIAPIIGKHYSTVARRLRNMRDKKNKHVCQNTMTEIPEEDLDMIKKLYQQGYCPQQIGRWLDIKATAIIYRLKKCGIYKQTNTRITNQERDRIIELHKNGKSNGQIAIITGRSRSVICQIIRKYKKNLEVED